VNYNDDNQVDLVVVGPEGRTTVYNAPGFTSPAVADTASVLSGCTFLHGMTMRSGTARVGCLIAGFTKGDLKVVFLSEGRSFGEARALPVPPKLREPGMRLLGMTVTEGAAGKEGEERTFMVWNGAGDVRAFRRPTFEDALPGFEGVRIPEGARAAYGDVTGDGLPDLLTVLSDGTVCVRTNQGNRHAPHFSGDVEVRVRFPLEAGYLARPALADLTGDGVPDLVVGTKDGKLHTYQGPAYRPFDHAVGALTVEGCAAPAFGDLDRDGHVDLLVGGKGGILKWFRGPAFEEAPFPPLLKDPEAFPVPALCDLNGDKILDLLIGTFEGTLLVFRGIAPVGGGVAFQAWADHPLAGKAFGRSAAPTAGDLDGDGAPEIAVGNQKGELRILRGPAWERDGRWLGEIDLGELASPALVDVDRDGRLDLVAGGVTGGLSYYRNGGTTLVEVESWRFQPTREIRDLRGYRDRYLPLDSPFLAGTDTETLRGILTLLSECEENHLDEAAFAVAHTPVEILRAMARLGHTDLLRANAACITDAAKALKYVSLVEEAGRTTLAYKRADGTTERLPHDIYYWWVVHPRLLYEVPARIDASWWQRSAKERGMKDEDWLKKEPEKSVYAPGGGSAFWRSRLPNDASHGKTLSQAVAEAESLDEALRAIHRWLTPGKKGNVMRFGYLTRDLQPLVIFQKGYGSCGEQSIIGAACARTMLIASSIVTDRGEDHQWNEFWMGGEWHHWDVCHLGGIDTPWSSTEGKEHKGKTVTAVLRWRGDDVQEPVTRTVAQPKDAPYTSSGKGYTDTARVRIKVMDRGGKSVDGALILFRSHWNHRNMIGHWGYTGPLGTAEFHVGYQAHGGYTIEVLSHAGIAGIQNFSVEEGKEYGLTLKVPGRVPSSLPVRIQGEGIREGKRGRRVRFRLDEGIPYLLAKNVLTGIKPVKPEDKTKAYVFRTTGFRGTVATRLPLESELVLPVLLMDRENYGRFCRGEPSTAYGAAEIAPGRESDFQLQEGDRLVLVNLSHRTWIRAKATGSTFMPAENPTLKLQSAGVTLPTGATVEWTGSARDNGRMTSLSWSIDGGQSWHDVTSALSADGSFTLPWRAGLGGPLPSGNYSLLFRARDASGRETQQSVRVAITPSATFLNQPVRQDNPESPLPKSSWILGPFVLPPGERFLDVTVKGSAEGFDMDMFLFHDKNGNGRLDGMQEKIAASTSPLASERIYLDLPPKGIYWLYCQGWQVKQDSAPIDVKLSFTPRAKIVTDFSPSGFLSEKPREIACKVEAPSGIDPSSIRVLFDGKDVTGSMKWEGGRVSFAPPEGSAGGQEHKVQVSAKDRAGNEDQSTWTYAVDTVPPKVAFQSPDPGATVSGKIKIRVRASDDRQLAGVRIILNEGKPKRMKREGKKGDIYILEIDLSPLKSGVHQLKVEGEDAAGNRDFETLQVKVAEPEKG
jgi:hypothetical protein